MEDSTHTTQAATDMVDTDTVDSADMEDTDTADSADMAVMATAVSAADTTEESAPTTAGEVSEKAESVTNHRTFSFYSWPQNKSAQLTIIFELEKCLIISWYIDTTIKIRWWYVILYALNVIYKETFVCSSLSSARIIYNMLKQPKEAS